MKPPLLRSAERRWQRLLAWLALALAGLLLQAPAAASPRDDGTVVVGVVLNTMPVADAVLAYPAEDGGWWLPAAQLKRWRLRPDEGKSLDVAGEPHREICGPDSGTRCQHDTTKALLIVQAEPARLEPLRYSARPMLDADAPPASLANVPGGFYANYDLQLGGGAARTMLAQVDARAFAFGGEFYLQAAAASVGSDRRLFQRAWGWQRDLPEQGWTFTLGGFASSGHTAASGLPMLGLRWASQRSLQPDRSWLQKPVASGMADLGLQAELLVDGRPVRTAEVPYGPFQIEADVLRAGAGQMQLVTTDNAGRRQLRSIDYYVAPQLLPPGTAEHVLEIGAVGDDIGRPSLRGPIMAAGRYRLGLDKDTTVDAHGLVANRTHILGMGVDRGIGQAGVLRAGLTLVDRGGGLRPRLQLAHEYLSERWSSTINVESGPAERPVPLAQDGARDTWQRLLVDRRRAGVALNWSPTRDYQAAVALNERIDVAGTRQRSAALNLTWQGPSRLRLVAGLQAMHNRPAGAPETSSTKWAHQATLTLVLPLGRGDVLAASARVGNGRPAAQWTYQSAPASMLARDGEVMPNYRLYGESSRQAWAGATAWQDTRYGQWQLDARSGPGASQYQGRFSGAVGWLGGSGFVGPRVDDSFVVVDTDGHAGVPVFLENRPVGVTGRDGRLVVTGARAWQANRVTVDGAVLPIENTLTSDELRVRPWGRAGALAHFEVGDGGELVSVRLADGTPLPAGAQASIEGQADATAVGSRSELFVMRAGRQARISVRWAAGSCAFDYVPRGQAGRPSAGESFTCR
jgi:outer membrane usher protein